MDTVSEFAPAKLNLTLDIVGESSGFHLLDMLVCSIDTGDTVTLSERKDKNIVCRMNGEIQNGSNSAVRAARLIMGTFKTSGFDIEIQKRIPMAGGLGGSTADGTAVVRAASKLLDINAKKITADWLINLGSDAPCMYANGLKRVRGIGQIIDFIDINLPYKVGYIANNAVDTKAAYALFDKLKIKGGNSTERAVGKMDNNSFDIAEYLSNDLFLPAITLCPEINSDLTKIKNYSPAAYSMSGSGGTVYGLFENTVPSSLLSAALIK